MKSLAFALVIAICGCGTFRQEWRDRIAIADASLLACDTFQTIRFSDYGTWDLGEHGVPIREANPILGYTPSPTKLIGWLAVSLSSVLLADRVGGRAADVALVALGIAESVVVGSNLRYGGACGFGPTNLERLR